MVKSEIIPCTKEEIDSIIKSAEDNDYYYTLFLVAKTTGRRLGELYGLKVEDIDFERGIMMTQILKRRQRVKKEAILDEKASFVLKQYIRNHSLKLEDYVFRKVGKRSIQYAIVRYAKRAGVPHKVCFHNFRHYLITALIKKNWSYDQIAKVTGHSSVNTISVYDHAVASDIKEKALEALETI